MGTKYANTNANTISSSGGHVRVTIASTIGQGNGGTSLVCKGCLVSCPANNTGPVRMAIGEAASATVGIELPEAAYQIPFIPVDDVSSLYFYSATNGDIIDIAYFRG